MTSIYVIKNSSISHMLPTLNETDIKNENKYWLSKTSNGWHLCTYMEIIVCTICYVVRFTKYGKLIHYSNIYDSFTKSIEMFLS